MMDNLHLVTGFLGREHITATDQGAFNAALIGTGQFVLEKGKVFEAQVINNNLVRVFDGELMMQGRFVRLAPNEYADLAIENGEKGLKRNDLIVVRYTKDTLSGVESVNLVVIKGEAVEGEPVDPAFTEGDITNGEALLHEFPLWRIPIDGLNVGEPVALYGLPFIDSMQTLHTIREDINAQIAEQNAQYEAAFEEQNSKFQKAVLTVMMRGERQPCHLRRPCRLEMLHTVKSQNCVLHDITLFKGDKSHPSLPAFYTFL